MSVSEDDIEMWRHFKSGQSSADIAASQNIGVSSVLKIVLSVDSEMGTSTRFFNQDIDEEVCPNCTRKTDVTPPGNIDELEIWLR